MGKYVISTWTLINLWPSIVAVVVAFLPSAVVSGNGLLSWNLTEEDLKVELVSIWIWPSRVLIFLAEGLKPQAIYSIGIELLAN